MSFKQLIFGERPASLGLLGLALSQTSGALLSACRQSEDASANAAASTSTAPSAPRPSAVPFTTALASGSASATVLRRPPPPPPMKSCRDDPRYGEYWIRVEGDGEPQLLKEGPPVFLTPPGKRYCAPTGLPDGPDINISGCATEKCERSSVYMTGKRLMYHDRQGKRHVLKVSGVKRKVTGDVLDGTANASGPGRLKLKLSFHVGNDVRVLMPHGPDRNPI